MPCWSWTTRRRMPSIRAPRLAKRTASVSCLLPTSTAAGSKCTTRVSTSCLAIDGLWALGVGNGGGAGPTTTLFFTAGLNEEKDGLFGTLVPIASELAEADEP